MPKLLFTSVDEQKMVAAAGLPLKMLPVLGVFELIFAAITLFAWRWRSLFLWNIVVMMGALFAVGLQSPSYLVAAFNPVTLNVGMVLFSVIGYISAAELPSASHCMRHAAKRAP